MHCIHCGNEIPEKHGFCSKCGKQAGAPKTGLRASFIVALLAVSVSCFLFFHFDLRPGTAPATATQQSGSQTAPAERVRKVSAEDIFKTASPSVVLIEVFGDSGERVGTASGFVATEDGAVITNYHVVRGAHSASVHVQDGSTIPVQGVLGYDGHRDVAVVKVANLGAKALALGDSDRVQVGDRVVAIGSPLALQNTLSDGLVSGIRNGLIQTSTPISPGSSGGPFFNTNGEVVGIAVAGILGAENLNFVVPINWAKPYLHSSQITSLADLAEQNTVSHDVLATTISVPAHQQRVVPILVDRNLMASPELEGTFSSSGGAGGNVRVAVLSQGMAVYDSGRTNSGTMHLPLRAGAYQLVIDNSGSVMFARNVTCDIKLRYVK